KPPPRPRPPRRLQVRAIRAAAVAAIPGLIRRPASSRSCSGGLAAISLQPLYALAVFPQNSLIIFPGRARIRVDPMDGMNQIAQHHELSKPIRSRGQPLVDPFERPITYLRVSVTDRCDFRCVYCMSEHMTFLPKADLLTLEELDRLCSAFIARGVRK